MSDLVMMAEARAIYHGEGISCPGCRGCEETFAALRRIENDRRADVVNQRTRPSAAPETAQRKDRE